MKEDMMNQLLNPPTSPPAGQGMQGLERVWAKACKIPYDA